MKAFAFPGQGSQYRVMIGGLSNQVQQFFCQGLIRRFPVETFPRAVSEQVNCMIQMFLRHRQETRVVRKKLT